MGLHIKNGFAAVDWILIAAVILIGVLILIPYTVSEKQDKSIQICVKNLREIDKAMRLWQLDKGKPVETAVTFSEIASYLADGVSTNCPKTANGTERSSRHVAACPVGDATTGAHIRGRARSRRRNPTCIRRAMCVGDREADQESLHQEV